MLGLQPFGFLASLFCNQNVQKYYVNKMNSVIEVKDRILIFFQLTRYFIQTMISCLKNSTCMIKLIIIIPRWGPQPMFFNMHLLVLNLIEPILKVQTFAFGEIQFLSNWIPLQQIIYTFNGFIRKIPSWDKLISNSLN